MSFSCLPCIIEYESAPWFLIAAIVLSSGHDVVVWIQLKALRYLFGSSIYWRMVLSKELCFFFILKRLNYVFYCTVIVRVIKIHIFKL